MAEKITVDGMTLEILPESEPPDPRKDMDNLGKMVMFQKRYGLPNELGIDIEGSNSWQDLYVRLEKEFDCRVILPVYMMDHGQVWFRCGHGFGDIDPQGWDWGQVGFIVATRKDILDNFTGYDKNNKRLPMKRRISKNMIDRTGDVLRSEVSIYDKYARGEVYWFRVYDTKRAIANGNDPVYTDSCGGFYALEDMIGYVPKIFDERLRKEDFDHE